MSKFTRVKNITDYIDSLSPSETVGLVQVIAERAALTKVRIEKAYPQAPQSYGWWHEVALLTADLADDLKRHLEAI